MRAAENINKAMKDIYGRGNRIEIIKAEIMIEVFLKSLGLYYFKN